MLAKQNNNAVTAMLLPMEIQEYYYCSNEHIIISIKVNYCTFFDMLTYWALNTQLRSMLAHIFELIILRMAIKMSGIKN